MKGAGDLHNRSVFWMVSDDCTDGMSLCVDALVRLKRSCDKLDEHATECKEYNYLMNIYELLVRCSNTFRVVANKCARYARRDEADEEILHDEDVYKYDPANDMEV